MEPHFVVPRSVARYSRLRWIALTLACVGLWFGFVTPTAHSAGPVLQGALVSTASIRPGTAVWGDLVAIEGQLDHLGLPPGVPRLLALNPRLSSLSLIEAEIPTLDNLPTDLETLVLRRSKTRSIAQLPKGLTSLDVSYSLLERLPWEALPPHLEALKVPGALVEDWPAFPDDLKSLRLINPNSKSLLRRPFPPHLETLELIETGDLEQIEGLPASLRSLTLTRTKVRSLKGIPERLSELTLKASTGFALDKIPPYLGSWTIREGLDLSTVPTSDRFRFLHSLSIEGPRIRGSFALDASELCGLERLRTTEPDLLQDLLEPHPSGELEHPCGTVEPGSPWLHELELPRLPRARSLSLRPFPELVRLVVAFLGSVEPDSEVWPQLKELTVTLPYEGETLPPALESLELTLKQAPPAGLPTHLRRLTLRVEPGLPLEALLPQALPDLECLALLMAGPADLLPDLPSTLSLPESLQRLHLRGVALSSQESEVRKLSNLRELVLDRVGVTSLSWVPTGVKTLVLHKLETGDGDERSLCGAD